jgi:hypothetical protein
MTTWWRRLLLAVHLTVSIGWVGAVLAYISLDVAVAIGQDPETVRSAYAAMERIVRIVVIPLAIASLVTGILISLVTRWGLFRHYWVVISLVLTVIATGVLLRETQLIARHAAMAADPATTEARLATLPSTLVHSVGGATVLLVVLVLNVFKPRGKTKYGRRKAAGSDR